MYLWVEWVGTVPAAGSLWRNREEISWEAKLIATKSWDKNKACVARPHKSAVTHISIGLIPKQLWDSKSWWLPNEDVNMPFSGEIKGYL